MMMFLLATVLCAPVLGTFDAELGMLIHGDEPSSQLKDGDRIEAYYRGHINRQGMARMGKWYPATHKGLDIKGRPGYISVQYDDSPNEIIGVPESYARRPLNAPRGKVQLNKGKPSQPNKGMAKAQKSHEQLIQLLGDKMPWPCTETQKEVEHVFHQIIGQEKAPDAIQLLPWMRSKQLIDKKWADTTRQNRLTFQMRCSAPAGKRHADAIDQQVHRSPSNVTHEAVFQAYHLLREGLGPKGAKFWRTRFNVFEGQFGCWRWSDIAKKLDDLRSVQAEELRMKLLWMKDDENLM